MKQSAREAKREVTLKLVEVSVGIWMKVGLTISHALVEIRGNTLVHTRQVVAGTTHNILIIVKMILQFYQQISGV
jgi:hypothetical protein